jgi:tetratricopeptide (TPR) repeat protein
VPSSDELVRKGWHFFSRRTKQGAERAIECFLEASAQYPGDFKALEGLSTCYLMQAVFGIRQPLEAHAQFLEAHERAVGAGGLTPELRCNRAHGLNLFEHRPHEAEVELLKALADKPSSGTAYVRLAILYATLGNLDQALASVQRAYEVDPLLPTLPSTNVNVHVWRGEFDQAIAIGSSAIELHPYLQISRSNYAQALEFSGRLQEALVQYQLGSMMAGDLPWMRALEGTCLAKLDRIPEARAILDELEHRRAREYYCDAMYMAVLRNALGERAHALQELERALDESSAFLHSMTSTRRCSRSERPRFTECARPCRPAGRVGRAVGPPDPAWGTGTALAGGPRCAANICAGARRTGAIIAARLPRVTPESVR